MDGKNGCENVEPLPKFGKGHSCGMQESGSGKTFWISEGLYPRESGGGGDKEGRFSKFSKGMDEDVQSRLEALWYMKSFR
jgi:hypothetical protein